MDLYAGQLVVLRSRWNLQSTRLGIVLGQKESPDLTILILWTDEKTNTVKLKYHLSDAIIPVNDQTIAKIKERICDIE